MRAVLSLVAALLATAAADDCPGGFVSVGSACYLFPDSMQTWYNANHTCSLKAPFGQLSGLAHIQDCNQHADLWKYIEYSQYEIVDYWIGGRDDEQEGVFRWVSTGLEIPREVPFWFPGQPDGWINENALSLSKTGYFADEDSKLLQKFICQLL